MNYQQLTCEERYQISTALKCKKTNPEIGVLMDRHRSTIWRERNRNSGGRGYRPKQAQEKTMARRQDRVYAEKLTPELEAVIREKLALQWSPEQIGGRLTVEGHESLCPETIYRFIKRDRDEGGSLWINLRRSNRRRKKRFGTVESRGQIKDRTSIEDRPQIVEKRKRIGDFERDTVIGKGHKGVLLTIVDRVSKKVFIGKIGKKTAALAHGKTLKLLAGQSIHSLTNDNGKEFAQHKKTAKELNTQIFFTHAYSSQERGTNENTNGLIRQYFPKSMDLRSVTVKEIKRVVNLLDLRPRKNLGYRTPLEVHLGLKSNYQLVALAM